MKGINTRNITPAITIMLPLIHKKKLNLCHVLELDRLFIVCSLIDSSRSETGVVRYIILTVGFD